ncbi:hypothetical protein Micbo1qcDRAFT_158955 [Microdochium bolleyi]|uniref:Uncharacterized protein n=1 Tax=Microdochium bolleyi TaxID=196109 RepID=A0A136JA46_9PEZI|nr:hypothetical protein Micbo1qcDRAFT_158955 [Microdochium bolleyi]
MKASRSRAQRIMSDLFHTYHEAVAGVSFPNPPPFTHLHAGCASTTWWSHGVPHSLFCFFFFVYGMGIRTGKFESGMPLLDMLHFS